MRPWLRWALPFTALPVLALLAFGLTRDARRLPSALAGGEAPPFKLANLYDPGDSLAVQDLRGKVVVLNFWASWCAPCLVEHPVLIRLSETYDPEDVVLLGVLYQDTPERGRAFFEQLGGDWPSVMDPGSRTAIRYGVYGVPETFFIGADGRVASRHESAVTWELVTSKVDSLLAARGARPADTMPLETATPAEPAGTDS
ncbi:MAG: redoxin family protein [Gemmatimonadota bacterium]|nr:redoxin family protein [Gemmatimonadota bacterium]